MSEIKNLDTVWRPDPLKCENTEYFHKVDAWVRSYLPNASLSDAEVFYEDGKMWLGSNVWDFETKRTKPARVEIPWGTEMP